MPIIVEGAVYVYSVLPSLCCVIWGYVMSKPMFVFSREILVEESNVQRVDSPVTVSNN